MVANDRESLDIVGWDRVVHIIKAYFLLWSDWAPE